MRRPRPVVIRYTKLLLAACMGLAIANATIRGKAQPAVVLLLLIVFEVLDDLA